VVIRGDQGAELYKGILKILDVPISETKTHVSDDTFEFAKRWFRHGEEITPFPLNSFKQAQGRYVDLGACLNEVNRR